MEMRALSDCLWDDFLDFFRIQAIILSHLRGTETKNNFPFQAFIGMPACCYVLLHDFDFYRRHFKLFTSQIKEASQAKKSIKCARQRNKYFYVLNILQVNKIFPIL